MRRYFSEPEIAAALGKMNEIPYIGNPTENRVAALPLQKATTARISALPMSTEAVHAFGLMAYGPTRAYDLEVFETKLNELLDAGVISAYLAAPCRIPLAQLAPYARCIFLWYCTFSDTARAHKILATTKVAGEGSLAADSVIFVVNPNAPTEFVPGPRHFTFFGFNAPTEQQESTE